MKKNIFLVVMLVLFASKGFANLKENVPSGLFLSGNIGLGSFENLAMAKNHTFVDSNFTHPPLQTYMGIELKYAKSIFDIETKYIGSGSNEWSLGNDTILSAGDIYIPLKVGINTLPSYWYGQFIPEFGYFYYEEHLSKDFIGSEKDISIYSEKLNGNGFLYGFSLIGMIRAIETNFSLEFNYSHNCLEKIKIDNYLLQAIACGKEPSGIYSLLLGCGIGLSTKTDGRRSYYASIELGVNLFAINELLEDPNEKGGY
jgi:hypothetical protein